MDAQEQNTSTPHTEELSKLIVMLGRATNLMGRARTVVDLGQHALPQVSEKLQSISYASEEAAMSIMNETDNISTLADQLQHQIQVARRAVTDLSIVLKETQKLQDVNVDPNLKSTVDLIATAIYTHEAGLMQSLGIVGDGVEQVRRSAMSISMTLQVQDITAQQLAGAGQMVDHVQSNLTSMFTAHQHDTPQAAPKVNEAFNPDAKFDSNTSRQSAVDDLFNAIHKDMEG